MVPFNFGINFSFHIFVETTKNIDVYLFLFDDMLLITKSKRGRKVCNFCLHHAILTLLIKIIVGFAF